MSDQRATTPVMVLGRVFPDPAMDAIHARAIG